MLAQRILDWRTAHGRFSSVDELGEVSGIGEATLGRPPSGRDRVSGPPDQDDVQAGTSDPLDARLAGPAVAAWVGAFVGTGAPAGRSVGWLVVLGIGLSLTVAAVVAGRAGRSGLARAVVLVLLCLLAGSTVGALQARCRARQRAGRARHGRCHGIRLGGRDRRPGAASRAAPAATDDSATWSSCRCAWTGSRLAGGWSARVRRCWCLPWTGAGRALLPGQRWP